MISYLCDYESCQKENTAQRMIYLRMPMGYMGPVGARITMEVRRFCSKEHLFLWVRKNLAGFHKKGE